MVLLLLIILHFCSGFNLDVENAKVFDNPVDSDNYFGYSVAIYPAGTNSVILVGAPRANSSRLVDTGIVEPGAVYRCRVDEGDCTEWIIDEADDHTIFGNSRVRQKKDHAWLGGSIFVQNSTKPKVVVCAPGWKKNPNDHVHWYMIGMCYSVIAEDSTVFDRVDDDTRRHFPFMSSQTTVQTSVGNLFYYGMAQAGFSAHLTPDRGDLVLGAPGVLHWAGSIVMINDTAQRNSYISLTPNILHDYNFEYSDYFGYSVTSGRFFDLGRRTYAAGAPRSDNTFGKVFIFDFPSNNRGKLQIKSKFRGEQLGEYFGYSLASCDLNNDGRDDLIVGAPQWSNQVDEGRVYVFISKGHFQFDRRYVNGEIKDGRFGTSVVCLGDLDYDGYADVAVGAPYEDGQGTVYVYSGISDGLILSQKIPASDIRTDLQGFGFSISEPRDVDGNNFGDLAVGAYLSGHVILIKTKPAIRVELELSKTTNFNLTEKLTRFSIDACAIYDGLFAPDTYSVMEEFEIDKTHKRGFVYKDKKLFGVIYKVQTTLKRGKRKCITVPITLKKEVQNLIEPIEIKAQIYNDEKSSCENCPAIDPKISKVNDILKLNYILDVCGPDNVCICDLSVKLNSNLDRNNTYIIGSNTTVYLEIKVENSLEPAYNTKVHIFAQWPIVLTKVPLECVNGTAEITCNIDNVLYKKTVFLEFNLVGLENYQKYQDIQVNVTTLSQENDLSNNNETLRINFDIDTSLEIIGKSHKESYSYFKKEVTEEKIKKLTINHVYEVLSFGLTPVEKATLIINMPVGWDNTELIKVTKTHGTMNGQNFSCSGVKITDEFSLMNIPTTSEKRTIYINSKNSVFQRIICDIGPFHGYESVAKVIVTVEFDLFNTARLTEDKDTIVFGSEGFIEAIEPNKTQEVGSKRSVWAQTSTTISITSDREVSIWIFVFSTVVGMLLLIIISLVLNQFGFFNRSNWEDLDALSSAEMVNQNTYHKEDSEITETELIAEL